MKVLHGNTEGKGLKIAVVLSRFNPQVTDRLLDGALEALLECQVPKRSIYVVAVPGAFDIPAVAKKIAGIRKPDAIVCLGAVIRGETEHFTYVCKAAQEGIVSASLECGIPMTFGVLTTNDWEQAMARSQTGSTNKGYQAARDAVELANTIRLLGK